LLHALKPQSKKESIAPNKTGYGIAAAQLLEEQPLEIIESQKS
jgi:hypothetical protein